MKSVNIVLNSIEKANNFVRDMGSIEGDAVISLGRYYISAKSLLGVFSLDLTKPLELEIGNWKEEYGVLVNKYMTEL